MASIYLIRHGQASFGSDDYDRLSPLGSRQAEVTGWYLRDQGVHFDAVYSGTLKRQQDTARAVCASQPGQCPLTVDVRFNEIDNDEQLKYLLPIVAERNPSIRALMKKGLSASKDYQKVIDAVFNYWVSQECDEPRIQSWADYSSDVRQALEDVISAQGRGKTIGIFSSGGTIATVVAQVLGLGGEHTYRFYEPVFNCSISQLFYSPGRVSLSSFNDVSFLRTLGRQLEEQLVSYR